MVKYLLRAITHTMARGARAHSRPFFSLLLALATSSRLTVWLVWPLCAARTTNQTGIAGIAGANSRVDFAKFSSEEVSVAERRKRRKPPTATALSQF